MQQNMQLFLVVSTPSCPVLLNALL